MKQIILFFIFTLSVCLAFSESDRLYYIYVEQDQATYYLSAPFGGGDEMVSKKITNEPKDNETFHMEYVSKNKLAGNTRQYRIKTFRNYYVSVNEDGDLVAEDKVPAEENLFEVKIRTMTQDTIKGVGRTFIKRVTKLYFSKRLADGSTWYLFFDKEEKRMAMKKSIPTHEEQIFAEILDVTITSVNAQDPTPQAMYELRWIKPVSHNRQPSHLRKSTYLRVRLGRTLVRSRNPADYPIYLIWKTDDKFDPIKFKDNLAVIDLKPRNSSDPPPKLYTVQLWKNGKFYKSWKLDTKLEHGQRLTLFTNGSYKIY